MHKIIQRYIFGQFFAPFGISLLFFSFVFLISQLQNIMDYVVNYQINLQTVGLLLAYSMPYFLQFSIPMSVMIAVLLTFLRMSADMEIIALKAGGMHIYSLIPPVALFALTGALLTAFMGIVGLPVGQQRTRQLLQDVVAAHVDIGLKPRQFINTYKDLVIYIGAIDNATRTLTDVFIEDRRSSKMTSTVIAPRGQISFDPARMIASLRLLNGSIHQVDLKEQRANAIKFDTYDLRMDIQRTLASQSGDNVQGMSLTQLYHTIRTAQAGSEVYYKAAKEWHKKFALPVACLAFAVLAIPLGIRARSSKRAYGVGLGLLFFLLYYILLSLGWLFAESGIYPPAIGMWMPDAVIMTIGVALLVRAANEKALSWPALPNWLKRLQLRNSRR